MLESDTRRTVSADRSENVAAIVAWRLAAAEMLLPLCCVAPSEEGEAWLLFLLLRAIHSNENKHSFFFCCAPVSRLGASTVLALAKHATISSLPTLALKSPTNFLYGTLGIYQIPVLVLHRSCPLCDQFYLQLGHEHSAQ
jgi:hypothetical protein